MLGGIVKLYGLQIARGVAALGIVYFHSWVAIRGYPANTSFPILPLRDWGFLGVNFFFAISGFVICLVASRPDFTVGSFVVKRAFRIYPMYWVALFAFVRIGHSTRGPVESETWSNLLYSATLLPTNGMPYLDVAWSLQHEIFFYLIAAVTIPLLALRGLAILLFASAAAAYWFDLPEHSLPISHYHADFLAGVLAFLLRKQTARVPNVFTLLIGCAILFGSIETNAFAGFPFAAFMFVTWFVNLKIDPRGPIFSPLIKLGDASYSLYLLHPIIFLLALRDFDGLPLWTQEPIRWGSILVCCGLSYWTWKAFETPIIQTGEALTRTEIELDIAIVPNVEKSIAQVSACLTLFVFARCILFPLHTPLFLALRG